MKKGIELYLVCSLQEKHIAEVKALRLKQELKLSWIDGMVGVLPVFDDREKAEKYVADNKATIVELIVL